MGYPMDYASRRDLDNYTDAQLLAEMARRGLVDGDVACEMERAVRKFPTWPTDPLHALAVLCEEVGELTQAVLQTVYEPHKRTAGPENVRKEAVQVAAMALRFLRSLDRYEYTAGTQHQQPQFWAGGIVERVK